MSDFFERLDTLLKANHITQTYLADSLKIRRANFPDWRKNGNLPSADIAVKIAQALNTTVEYLVTGIEPESHTKITETKALLLQAIQNLDTIKTTKTDDKSSQNTLQN